MTPEQECNIWNESEDWMPDGQVARGVAKPGPHRAEPNHEDDVRAKVAHEITLTALCCHEALQGYWDRNDEGFKAMKNGLERALTLLGYPMPDYAKRDEEEGSAAC